MIKNQQGNWINILLKKHINAQQVHKKVFNITTHGNGYQM